jgi:Xaa-Pro aminopeptidase
MPRPKSLFETDFFINNRKSLRNAVDKDLPIILSANGLLQKSLDSAYPFRQDSNFWYLTGLDEPSLVLVMDASTEYLILPRQSDYMIAFDGEIEAKDLVARSGIKKVYSYADGWEKLGKMIKKNRKIASVEPPPAFIEQMDLYTNPARAHLKNHLKDINKRLKIIDIKPELAELRVIKQKPEIKAIEKATKHTIKAFELMSRKLKTASAEYELEAVANLEFTRHGLSHAYEPIVAAGVNAATLHYVSNDQTYNPSQLVLIDAGASFDHYASDVTRTIGVKPTKRQLAVHGAVNEAYEFAMDLVKPGIHIRDFEEEVRSFLGEKLRELKLVRRANKKNMRRYYPHATSHFIGLDVHDPGPADGILRPGMVVTIEPGIYIKEENIGVRIEDIVLITKDGKRILSEKLSRSARSLRIN